MSQQLLENSMVNLATVSQDLEKHSLSADKLINQLSFSHFVELLKVDDAQKRLFYEIECIKGTWSVRELK